MLGEMRISSLDLDEALAANGLVATSRVVEVGRIRQKTNRTFVGVLVKKDLEGLPVDEWVMRQGDFFGRQVRRRRIAGAHAKDSQGPRCSRLERRGRLAGTGRRWRGEVRSGGRSTMIRCNGECSRPHGHSEALEVLARRGSGVDRGRHGHQLRVGGRIGGGYGEASGSGYKLVLVPARRPVVETAPERRHLSLNLESRTWLANAGSRYDRSRVGDCTCNCLTTGLLKSSVPV